jgi:hypothetical protein
MAGAHPPVTRGTHVLPFASLSPVDFERLCFGLVRREGYERAEHLGATGRDDGCDIVAFRNDRRIVFQCKRYEKLGPKDAEAVVAEILSLPEQDRPAELILLATCTVSPEARQRARQKAGTIDFQVWALTELDERVHRHPDLLAQFFDLPPHPARLGSPVSTRITSIPNSSLRPPLNPEALVDLKARLRAPQDTTADFADATTITSWFETGVAYIDPDDHGPVGFVLVPFLMLLYDKVIVHSPYAGQIVTAERDLPPEFRPLLLEWADLRDLACDPGIEDAPTVRITAFPTYVDAHLDKTRDQEFRAIKGVDAERLDPSSALYKSIALIEEDPRPLNAEWARALAEGDQHFELAKRRIRDGGLPPRFVQALKGEDFFCPRDLAEWWPYAVPEQKLVALAAYDYLNDRSALQKGGGNVHCLTAAGEFAAELLLGIDDAIQVVNMENPQLQSQRVLDILKALGYELQLPRIDAAFIRKFRKQYRADFVRDISTILEKISQEPDPVRRKRLIQEQIRAAAQLDRFPIILGQSLNLLLKLLPPFTLGIAKSLLPKMTEYIEERVPGADPTRRRRWRYALRKKS